VTILVLVIVVFGLLSAAAVTGIVLHIRRSAERTDELRRLAPSLGLTPIAPEQVIRGEQPGEAAIWDAAGGTFGLVSRGIVDNLFRGERDGREVWLFDFSYSRTPGPSSGGMRATVVSLALREPLPPFRMTPEGRLHRQTSNRRPHRAQREKTRQVISALVGGFSPRPSEWRVSWMMTASG
jgi:hypothetical protein